MPYAHYFKQKRAEKGIPFSALARVGNTLTNIIISYKSLLSILLYQKENDICK